MPNSKRVYVGLASSFHDPAIAVVTYGGQVLFAEATERRLQDKRAINSPPDGLNYIYPLLRRLVADRSHLVVASSWSSPYRLSELIWLARGHTSTLTGLRWLVPTHKASVVGAGRNLKHRIGMARASESDPNWSVERRRHDHHLCHAATTIFSSPFDSGVCAIVDGAGQGTSASFFSFEGTAIRPIGGPPSVASLGLFYALLCEWCGFDSFRGEEWKVMGLAAHGEIDEGLRATLSQLVRVDGLRLVYGMKRRPHQELTCALASLAAKERASDQSAQARWAATGQKVFEDVMSQLLGNLADRTKEASIALGGGCVLNSSFNGKLLDVTPFERLHTFSAPADDGNALGAAWLSARQDGSELDELERPLSPYLGSTMSVETLGRLRKYGVPVATVVEDPSLVAARMIAGGKIVGWVQGRSEFGPRALGNRSILADPRDRGMQDRINATVKFREEFRPLAPAILFEHVKEYFGDAVESPYMDRALPVSPAMRHLVPAVVHVDGTARLQVISERWNPLFYALLCKFLSLTGIPLVVNTSLNVMGRPIVHSVEDALGVFFTTGLDAIFVGDVMVTADRTGPRTFE